MRLIALEIPEEPAELAGWLERHLVGPDLAGLVAELEAVHGRGEDPAIEDSLRRYFADALAQGLAGMPRSVLAGLMCRPQLLLELQEQILIQGGPRWNRFAREGNPGAVDRGHHRLFAALTPQTVAVAQLNPVVPEIIPIKARLREPRRGWRPLLAVAASMLLAVVGFEGGRRTAPPGVGWGWAKAGALADDQPRAAYLAGLADSAAEWFRQMPADPPALAKRIVEFRQGCSALILADHRPLPVEDQAWLVGKCREWAAKLDVHLAELESGKDLAATRAEVDEVVRKLVRALRNRAREDA